MISIYKYIIHIFEKQFKTRKMKKGSYWIGTLSVADQKKFRKDITELYDKKRFDFIMTSYYATFERFISCSFDVANNDYWNNILLRSKML